MKRSQFYLLLLHLSCSVTGINGIASNGGRVSESDLTGLVDTERTIMVDFDATVQANLDWEFRPLVKRMEVHPGKIYQTAFTARNPTSHDMVGQAVPSVAPNKASRYFNKTECFCFNQQPLAAGESKEMPLRFIVDPNLPEDVQTLTLAYTVFDVTQVAMN